MKPKHEGCIVFEHLNKIVEIAKEGSVKLLMMGTKYLEEDTVVYSMRRIRKFIADTDNPTSTAKALIELGYCLGYVQARRDMDKGRTIQ